MCLRCGTGFAGFVAHAQGAKNRGDATLMAAESNMSAFFSLILSVRSQEKYADCERFTA